MTYAPADVTKKARMKMLDRTLLWVAARDEKQIPPGLADCYAKSLVQLLTEPGSKIRPVSVGIGVAFVDFVVLGSAVSK